MNDDLPIGWVQSPLINLLSDLITGKRPKGGVKDITEGVLSLGGEHISSDGRLKLEKPRYIPHEFAQSIKHALIRVNDILIVKDGATTGKTAFIFDNQLNEVAYINEHLFICRSCKEIHPLYLFYFLRSEIGNKAILSDFRGAAQGGIGRQFVHKVIVPCAPLNEQRRIVEKLDRIFDRLRRVRDELSHIKKLIDRYKQSVLMAACSSESYDKGEIISIQSVAYVGTGSTPLKSNSSYYANIGIPWITSAATNQPFVTKASEFVTEYAISECRLKKYPIGTLLVAMYGEGKTRGQVTELAIEATINQACAAIIVNESLACKEYVKLALQANYFEMRELAEGGNQPNLNLSKIKNFPIFLPPLKEQKETVRRVEERFAKIEKIEQEYQKAVKLCDRLEQETLAKAFRGELVPQDPNDEPASVLLERIRAEQQAKTKAKTAKSKKRSGKK